MKNIAERRPLAVAPGPDDRVYAPGKLAAGVARLVAEAVPAEQALAGTGLIPAELESPRTRLSLNQILIGYGNIARLTADPHFGFRLGESFRVSGYGMFGFAILSSTDFRATAQFVINYRQLAVPLTELSFTEGAGLGCWTIGPLAHPLIDGGLARFLVEMQFGLIMSLHRDVMGPLFQPTVVQFTWAEPADAASYTPVLGCPPQFGREANRFFFDAAWLDGLPAYGNALTNASVVALCDAQLSEIGRGTGMAGQVRHLLLTRLMRPMSAEAAATELGQSARSLRRRLAEEGTSFRAVVDGLRMDLAIRYLRDQDRTVEATAFALGFADAASFRRAFRRWTQQAPGAFRGTAGHLVEDDSVP